MDGTKTNREPLLSTEQAAAWLGVSPRFLTDRRYKGGGPRFIRLSAKVVKYDPSDLRAWLNGRAFGSTAEEPRRADKEAA